MAVGAAVVTVEQFLALPEEQQFRRELIQGEIVEMGNAKARHEIIKSRVNLALAEYILQHRELALLPESMFISSPIDACIPDVSIVRSDSLKGINLEDRFRGGPLLAVEVISSEPAKRVEQKVEIYLTAGAQAVWLIYPGERVVVTHHPGPESGRFHLTDTLEEPAILPGFRLAVRDLFAELE
jgi:Uma2 family endonuclease